MYNYVMLIGYVDEDIKIRELSDGKKVCDIVLNIKRDFKNTDGQYTYDKIKVSVWDFLVDIAKDNVKKGKKIGIKGRLCPRTIQTIKEYYIPVYDIIGERFIFFESFDDQTLSEEEVLQEKVIPTEKEAAEAAE